MLQISDLSVTFSRGRECVRAVDGVNLELAAGEVLGLVGESGSGKSVLSLAILGLVPAPGVVDGGPILWNGNDLMAMSERQLRGVRGRQIAMIFQNPHLSFSPVQSVGQQISSVLRLHFQIDSRAAREETIRLLDRVRIPNPSKRFHDYPHQLSGGLCQRAMIAMALGCQPQLLIADEPTSSLDVTIQAQIVDLLLDLNQEQHMSILLISHDLGVVASSATKVAVMQGGRIVERGPAAEIYARPQHDYTRLLLASVPAPDPTRARRRLPGATSA
jgi:peptide/nickel transport system ATP-binding protein